MSGKARMKNKRFERREKRKQGEVKQSVNRALTF